MRKWNAVLSMIILVLFLIHGILGAFQMLGTGSVTLRVLAHTLFGLILIHTVLGIVLTVQSIRVWKKTKVPYLRQNLLFWTRRISGLVIMVLIFFHMSAFSYYDGDVYRLKWFTAFRLAVQLLLVLSLAVHVISNVKPMLIAFGIRSLKERAVDILFVLSLILLFMAAAFIVYYIRWNMI